MNPGSFILERDAVMQPYTADVAAYCEPFSCNDNDLDEFFSKDAFLYETELLGKTYAWIKRLFNNICEITGWCIFA